ncbi:MAG: hypothetical protein A2167_04830 [Planctomycetes bacterium RBG_13_46_10]|nr:MAG: hypothetical protein A2167_04830 [Planctomycetes bacterium RBG_13_46_10]
MDKTDINKKNDNNILRAGDIIPPYKRDNPSEIEPPELEIPGFNLAEKIMAEQRKVVAVKRKAPSHKSILDTGYSIPVENRELRKACPERSRGEHREAESVRHAVMPPTTLLFNQQEIIARIVARDIAQMCQYRMTYPASP